jgi:molecular chaperone GrpE (heat shock protein)
VHHPSMRRPPAAAGTAFAILVAMGLAACQSAPPRARSATASAEAVRRSASGASLEAVTPEQLRQMNLAFADRFTTYLINADIGVARAGASPRQRQLMHRIKTFATTAAYDIVTDGDPGSQLLDLLLYVTLQSYIWIDEGEAVEAFGPEAATPLVEQLHAARVDIWRVAAQALTTQQLETLDNLILQWRRSNPSLDYLAFVRFDEIAAAQGATLVRELRRDGSLFAPVNQAIEELEKLRDLGERALFLSKRAPMLAGWQIEDAVNTVANREETAELLAAVTSLSQSVERVTATVETLPHTIAAEREAAIESVFAKAAATIEAAHGELGGTLDQATAMLEVARGIAESGERIAETVRVTTDSVDRTIGTADLFMKRFDPPPGSPPPPVAEGPPPTLDDYLRSVVEVTTLLREANLVVASSQGLLESEAWQRRLEQVNLAADERLAHASKAGRDLVRYSVMQSLWAIAAIFAGIAGLRLLGAVLPRRSAA